MGDWSGAVQQLGKLVGAEVHRLAQRRRFKKLFLSRSKTWAMGHERSRMFCQFLLLSRDPNVTQEAIQLLREGLQADIFAYRSYQEGTMAVLQLMEDSCTALIHVESNDKELFLAWYHGTRSRNLFQSYGMLLKASRAVSKSLAEEKEQKMLAPDPICDVEECGCPVRRFIRPIVGPRTGQKIEITPWGTKRGNHFAEEAKQRKRRKRREEAFQAAATSRSAT